jgi:hypothetical protein
MSARSRDDKPIHTRPTAQCWKAIFLVCLLALPATGVFAAAAKASQLIARNATNVTPLHWLVTACRASDGSYWALQSWQRSLPDLGHTPATALQRSWDLRLSHWTGNPPKLWISVDWAYQRYHHLFGSFSYAGYGVYGFRATPTGTPLDDFGRNRYVDTFNSAYGPGWKRENSFLTRASAGTFCYGFYPHGQRPTGTGSRYRATIIGPGLTPDGYWEAPAPGPYNPTLEQRAAALQTSLFSHDTACKPL